MRQTYKHVTGFIAWRPIRVMDIRDVYKAGSKR